MNVVKVFLMHTQCISANTTTRLNILFESFKYPCVQSPQEIKPSEASCIQISDYFLRYES